MSGIWGLVCEAGSDAVRRSIDTMGRSFFRNGVEVQTCVSRRGGLGSARHGRGHPGLFREGVFQVVCDAEIYNRQELQSFLEGKGHRFQTADEAELILRLYLQHGLEGIHRIRGVFSFAIWNEEEGSLSLAADRLGVKPLNYFNSPREFLFSSNVRSLHPLGRSGEVDPQGIFDYLFFSFVPTPRTIFKGVQKLPPGHLLILKDRCVEVRQYWDMSYPDPEGRSARLYADPLKELIEESVKIHADYGSLSPQEIGAFLSGGTDSSTVAGMLTRLSARKVKTFSIGFGEGKYNEIEYARIASRHFGTEHHEYFVTPKDLLDALPRVVEEYDEPFGNASAIPTYYCARMAREHGIRVLLAGDGGDELFAGNARYQTDALFSLYQKIPSILRKGAVEPLLFGIPFGSRLPLVGRARKYILRSNIPNPDRFFSYELLSAIPAGDIFEDSFAAQIDPTEPLSVAGKYYRQVRAGKDLDRLLYLDLKLAIADNDLRKVNRMTDLAGIQVRYPLLDYKLAEFSGKIPACLKLRGGRLRYLFKEAMKDFLPPEIITKEKHGFGLPFSIWLKTEKKLQDIVYGTLLEPRSLQRGYFKKRFLENLVASHQKDETPYYGTVLWVFMMLELWHRENDNVVR